MKYTFFAFILTIFIQNIISAQTLELTSDPDGIGVEFTVLSTGTPINMINFSDYASGFTTGMKITVENDLITTTGGFSYGLSALANPPVDNNTGDQLFNAAYSVFGEQSSNFGLTYAGYFSGDVTITGTLSNPSDQKLKKEILPINNALDLLNKLNPSSYFYQTEKYSFMHLPEGRNFGLAAQNVEEVLPELVNLNLHPGLTPEEATLHNLGASNIHEAVQYKSVNYLGFIPVLIQGIKEQQDLFLELKEENKNLKEELNELRALIETIIEDKKEEE